MAVMLVGWRVRRRWCIPITLVFGASADLGPDPGVTMRPSWPLRSTFRCIGAQPTPAEFGATFKAHAAAGGRFDEDRAAAFLTAVIRRKATMDRTVGPHVMSVTLWHPAVSRRALCCFDPLEGH